MRGQRRKKGRVESSSTLVHLGTQARSFSALSFSLSQALHGGLGQAVVRDEPVQPSACLCVVVADAIVSSFSLLAHTYSRHHHVNYHSYRSRFLTNHYRSTVRKSAPALADPSSLAVLPIRPSCHPPTMPQRKTMSRDELSTIIHFAPTPLVVLDRNRCLARVNKLAQTTLGIDAKYCNGEAFSQWIVEGSQIAFAKALNHAAESKWSTVDNGDDWARPGSTVVALQSRRTALDQPGVPFWANVTVTACFENLPEANSAGYLHEAFYILCVSPISGLEKGKGHDRFTPKQSAEEQQLIAEEGRRTPRLRSSSLSNAAELSSSPSAPPVIHSLSESIMHNFDFPMCALTSDGQTFVRNRAMDGLLGVLSSSYEALDDTQNPGDSLPGDRDDEGSENSSSRDSNRTTSASRTEVDASWLFSHFKVFDPTFTTPMPESEYPLFKAAVLGQRFKHAIIGVIAADGARRVLECEGWPVYDAEGHGNFVSIGARKSPKDILLTPGFPHRSVVCSS